MIKTIFRLPFKRALSVLIVVLGLALGAHAQVTATVTDAGSQAWNNGTWSVKLITAPGNSVPSNYFLAGTNTVVSPQTQTGTLSATATLSVTLPAVNSGIAPANTLWQFTVCPQATAACFTANINITALNQVVTTNLAPPAIIINATNQPPNVSAYVDAEIINAGLGYSYFNLTSLVSRQCIALPCTGANWANSGGGAAATPGITGPVTNGLIGRFDIPSTDTAAALTDSSGKGNNGTATVGTTPTIGTLGGLQCSGSGASILSSALNSALTIMVEVQVQPPVVASTFEFPVIGNGNGAASNASGIALTTDALNVTLNANADWVYSFANGATQSRSRNSFWGTGDIALAMGATDHVYVNGQEGIYFVTGSSAGLQTVGAYQLCGAASGSGAGVQTYMPSGSTIIQVLFYNRVLSAGEIIANHQFMTQFAASHGFTFNQSWNLSASSSLLSNGDSITNGNGVTPFANLMTLNGTWNITNRGAAAQQMAQAQGTFPSNYLPYFNNQTLNQAMILDLSTNDVCGAGFTAAQTAANIGSFMLKARTAYPSVKLIASTMIDRATCSAIKDTLNTLIRAQWHTYADALADFAADPLLGADGANTNTYFQGDNIHPSAAGQANAMTPVAQRAINRLYGNNDFSTATVYGSAAAAAVATTAGSESGNTVTITFGATPANCNVGNTILIAGTTPAGYSRTTGWTILTRSATQITFTDDASALGAITVQGTGVCPQQQDADTYSIINFGAGNYSIESCVGYTGQNIYIRNINAASSTLLPFSAETITGGGATPTTLAAASTAILQSQLVSAAAGGCNWVRLQ